MSSYPPPPPPGQYPPAYDRYAMKAQRQALRDQARFQQAQQRAARAQMRAQLRIQKRSLRRNSILGPLIILAVGIVLLLAHLGQLSWGQSLHWYGRWWPAVLIVAGVVLLAEWAIDQQRENAAGQTRAIGGGVVFLLILLALAGVSARGIEYGLDWHDRPLGNGYTNWDHLFGDRHDADASMNWSMPEGTALVVRNPHGDVSVTGSSSDGQVHVSVHTETYAWKDADAEEKARRLQPTFSLDGGTLTLNVTAVDGGQADLTIQMPRNAPLTVQSNHGDVTVNEMAALVSLTANHGDIVVSGIDSGVSLHVNDSDASVSMHSIHGPVSIQGHSGDIDVSDVTGDLLFQGDFFGSTHLEHINGVVHFDTSRTHFSAARLDEEMTVDRDSLNASQLLGPVVLKTSSKNIDLDRVQGSVDLSNSNGSVELTNAPPLDTINVQNRHGSVDIGLPQAAGFLLNAQTRNGDMENDFGLSAETSGGTHTLNGRISTGGPTVTITTTDGDVTVRRSSVAPLPPAVPAPPAITLKPAKPAVVKRSGKALAPATPPPASDGVF